MADSDCQHDWSIVNLQNGYLVTEGCSHCGARASFFALEDRHHVDSYWKGQHKWNFLGSSQAVKFDLKCTKCGKEVHLKDTMALMLCSECRTDCRAGKLASHTPDSNVWVYVALCRDPSHITGSCIGPEETKALTEYFNSRIKTPGKKILIVPCNMRPSIDLCQGEVLADVGLKDLF